MPWGVYLDGAAVDVEKIGAEYEVVFTPIAVGSGRVAMMPPQIRVRFSAEGFATFCQLLADNAPIHVAREMPPEPKAA